MIKEKIKRNCLAFGILFISIFSFSLYSQATSLSNELLAWGFKRGKDHAQAELDSKLEKVVKEYNGITMGNKDEPIIYLTFDCGYEAGYTEQILDVLEKHNVNACFFITGHYLNSASDLVKRMIEDGHIVGNHTANHKCLPTISDEEIKSEVMLLHNSLYEKFGYEMSFFRPPKGEFSQKSIKVISDLNYRTVMWSSAYDDWDDSKQGRVEYGKKKILDNLHNGCVLLLHSTSKDNAQILEEVIVEARKIGYEFKSLNEFK